MKLRIGLIGLGEAWQTRHRPALRMLHDRFEVRAVYTSVPLLADPAAREFHAQRVDGYRALVQRRDVDAVLILESCWQGWLPMLAACHAGKAVYWAADLAFEPALAADLKARVAESGIAFMAEFPRRFAPATLRLKELIATQLGKPQLIFCHRRMPGEASRNTRNGEPSPQRLVDRELVELIDWCRYVVGRDPTSVSAVQHGSSQPPDYQCMSLGFSATDRAPPVTAQVSCGRYIPAAWHEAISFRPPSAMQICCEHGVAFIDLPSTLVWFDEAGRHLESLETELPVGEQLLSQFHRAVTSLVHKMGDLEDACRASEIRLAAVESARTGQRIPLRFQ